MNGCPLGFKPLEAPSKGPGGLACGLGPDQGAALREAAEAGVRSRERSSPSPVSARPSSGGAVRRRKPNSTSVQTPAMASTPSPHTRRSAKTPGRPASTGRAASSARGRLYGSRAHEGHLLLCFSRGGRRLSAVDGAKVHRTPSESDCWFWFAWSPATCTAISRRTASFRASAGQRQPHRVPHLRQPLLPATGPPPARHPCGKPSRVARPAPRPRKPPGGPPRTGRPRPHDRRGHTHGLCAGRIRGGDRPAHRDRSSCGTPSQPLVTVPYSTIPDGLPEGLGYVYTSGRLELTCSPVDRHRSRVPPDSRSLSSACAQITYRN
ncbi:hypothetical protein SUDANB180_03891 [Streptomyces sp. enrichment culture]